jgi:hypothetical protein
MNKINDNRFNATDENNLAWVQRLASVYNLWFLLKKTGGLCINN